MSEGTIQAGDFVLGTPVVVGAQTGAGLFQASFDLSDIIANIDPSDEIQIKGFKQLVSGGALKQYANETITGADLQAQIDQGVELDDLLLLPPVIVPEGYQTQCSVNYVQGTAKAVSWEYRNSVVLS